MRISYRQVRILIRFARKVDFKIPPVFIMRSVLGKELRRLVCLFRERRCADCGLKFTCAYSWIFETPIEKTTEVLAGRDRASHPFLMSCDTDPRDTADYFTLNLTLIGKGIEYLPYIYYALVRAGAAGLFKERIPFKVGEVKAAGRSIVEGEDRIDTSWGIETWEPDGEEFADTAAVRVKLLTPLRLKVNGRFAMDFPYGDFIRALERRAEILTGLYGEGGRFEAKNSNDGPPRITTKNLKWLDLDYYSARQGERLKLGGLVGEFEAAGKFSGRELSLFRFGELFHVGKNVSFGLGRIGVERIGG
jgi:hypothetical protein